MKKILFLLAIITVLAGCKSTRHAQRTSVPQETAQTPDKEQVRYISAKMQLSMPVKKDMVSVSGTIKMITGERIQLSLQMPIIRTEMARIEITPQEVVLLDRLHKIYVRTTQEELSALFPSKTSFSALEQMLIQSASSQQQATLNGNTLGIPLLEKAQINLYNFSSAPLVLSPIQPNSSKYTQVSLEELAKIQKDLQ